MFIKTSELTGLALDWAVAQCEEQPVYFHLDDRCLYMGDGLGDWPYAPSKDWAHGGPLIEREKIDLLSAIKGWQAYINNNEDDPPLIRGIGPTPLIAAMRCYVASKLGDEVEIPDELT